MQLPLCWLLQWLILLNKKSYRTLEIYKEFLGEKVFISCLDENISDSDVRIKLKKILQKQLTNPKKHGNITKYAAQRGRRARKSHHIWRVMIIGGVPYVRNYCNRW